MSARKKQKLNGRGFLTVETEGNSVPYSLATIQPHPHNRYWRGNFATSNTVNQRWSHVPTDFRFQIELNPMWTKKRRFRDGDDIVIVSKRSIQRLQQRSFLRKQLSLFRRHENTDTWLVWGSKQSMLKTIRLLMEN